MVRVAIYFFTFCLFFLAQLMNGYLLYVLHATKDKDKKTSKGRKKYASLKLHSVQYHAYLKEKKSSCHTIHNIENEGTSIPL